MRDLLKIGGATVANPEAGNIGAMPDLYRTKGKEYDKA